MPVQFSLLILSGWGTGENIDHPIDTEGITAKNNHYWVSYPLKPNIFQSTKFRDQSIVIYGSIIGKENWVKAIVTGELNRKDTANNCGYSGAINVSIGMSLSTLYTKSLCQKRYIEPNLCYC